MSVMYSIVQCVTNHEPKTMKSKHNNAYVRTVGSRNNFFFVQISYWLTQMGHIVKSYCTSPPLIHMLIL